MKKIIILVLMMLIVCGVAYADLNTDLFSYWSFDVDATDDVGTTDGVVKVATKVDNCKKNGCYHFSGVSNNENISFIIPRTMENWTLSFWLYQNETPDNTIFVTTGINTDPANTPRNQIYENSGHFSAYHNGTDTVGTTTESSDKFWQHIVYTKWANGTISGFINNTNILLGNIKGVDIALNDILILGQNLQNTKTMNGTIDEVVLWNRTLSVAEVSNLWNDGYGTFYPFTPSDFPTDDLLSYWGFNGINLDTTGNGHDVIDTNDIVNITECIFGECRNFTSSPYMDIADSDDWAFGNDFTISMWINASKLSGATFPYLISQGTGDETDRWSIRYDVSGTEFEFSNVESSAETIAYDTSFNMEVDKLYHIVLTKNVTGLLFYVNGNSISSMHIDNSPIANHPGVLTFGAETDHNNVFNGKMDEIGIWDRYFNASEVNNLYNNRIGLFYTDCDPVDACCNAFSLLLPASKSTCGTCEECDGTNPTCQIVAVSQDPWGDCTLENCNTGLCDGASACLAYSDNGKYDCNDCEYCASGSLACQNVPNNQDPNADCTDSGFDSCSGAGTPYKCEKDKSSTDFCDGSATCQTFTTDVTSGFVCSGGSEIAGDNTFYSNTSSPVCSSAVPTDGFGDASYRTNACDGSGGPTGPVVGAAIITLCGTGCCYTDGAVAVCNVSNSNVFNYYNFGVRDGVATDYCYESIVYDCLDDGDCMAGSSCDTITWTCSTAPEDDVEGWSQLMNGNVVGAVYNMFNTAFAGWFVVILFLIYQISLYIKTQNATLCFGIGVFFAVLFATSVFVKALSVPIIFILLVFEIAGLLFVWLMK